MTRPGRTRLRREPCRSGRGTAVLERLLLGGALPLGKSDNFAAIDIGAGLGPVNGQVAVALAQFPGSGAISGLWREFRDRVTRGGG